MEGTMMDQLRYGGPGGLDLLGSDLSSSSWMDVLMSAVGPDMAQESCRLDVPEAHNSLDIVAAHHCPPDSSYNDGSLSSLDPGSTLGGNQSASVIFNDGWLDLGAPEELYTDVPACTDRKAYMSAVEQRDSRALPTGGVHLGLADRKQHVSGVEHNEGMRSTRKLYNNGPSCPERKPYLSAVEQHDGTRGMPIGIGIPSLDRQQNVSPSDLMVFSESQIPGFGVSPVNGVGNMTNGNSNYIKPSGDLQIQQQSSYQHASGQQPHHQMVSSNPWNGQLQTPRQSHHQPPSQQQHQLQFPQHQHHQQLRQSVDPESEVCGLRLVHLLLGCAESIQRGDLISAEQTLININTELSNSNQVLSSNPMPQQTGPMSRVAAHFAEALTKRIYGSTGNSQEALLTAAGIQPDALSEILHFQFYETCPYLKFAHFTANQAILEAFKGAKHVHVIDFNLNHGLQWPALIQALAMRQGGAPVLRLTGIGPPEVGRGDDSLKEIGMSLAALAEKFEVQFEFRGVVANKLDDIRPWMLEVRPGEVVAVNSMMQLHKLLYADSSTPAGIDEVLHAVRSLNPKIVTVSEQEANHNCPKFLDRFMEALHYYSSMFDSLEASACPSGSTEQMLAEMYLGREICNIVACEGPDRLERHESLNEWRVRMGRAGFHQVHMGANAFKQASMLLTLFSGQGYRVEDKQGCLTLCWDGRPLVAASAWCP